MNKQASERAAAMNQWLVEEENARQQSESAQLRRALAVKAQAFHDEWVHRRKVQPCGTVSPATRTQPSALMYHHDIVRGG